MNGKTQLISTALQVVDTIGAEKAQINLEQGAKGLRVRLEVSDVVMRHGEAEGISIDEGMFLIEMPILGQEPQKTPPKPKITVERMVLRLSAELLNRAINSRMMQDELRKAVPQAEIRGLNISFAGERFTLRGEIHKGLRFRFALDLVLQSVNNCLKVTFDNFWSFEMLPLPLWVRSLIMKVPKNIIERKPRLASLVSVTDNFVMINPWSKVPANINACFKSFGVQGHYLVLELGARPEPQSSSALPERVAPQSESAPAKKQSSSAVQKSSAAVTKAGSAPVALAAPAPVAAAAPVPVEVAAEPCSMPTLLPPI